MNLRTAFIAVSLLALVWLAAAHAGGPFIVDQVNNSGVALRWQNDTLTWYLDPGPVSASVNNATGTTWVTDQVAKWTSVTLLNSASVEVATSTLKSDYKGLLGADIDVTNYASYVDGVVGQTAVIFDADGSITAEMMGAENKFSVVGLSAPLMADGLSITKGFALFNGAVLESGVLSSDPAVSSQLFQATILHELGHLINLDHSQVNDSVAQACANSGSVANRAGTCANDAYIVTMYPELLTTSQATLKIDDKVSLSAIYPSASFNSDFCAISGKIYDADGAYLKGVNVIARRVDAGDVGQYTDVRSFVSGAMTLECTGDSTYYLKGIIPGAQYQVTVEPLNGIYTGASGFEPLDSPPSGFLSELVSDTAGSTTVSCSAGGETIQMASLVIDTPNPCTTAGGGEGDSQTTTSGSSGGCSLLSVPTGYSPLMLLVCSMLLLSLRRKNCR